MGQKKAKTELENPTAGAAADSSLASENFTCLNADELEKIQKSPKFSSRLLFSPRTHRPYFYFRFHGCSVEGFLGTSYDNRGVNRAKSYMIESPHGWEEFFANQHLQRLIEKHKLEGRYIKITYIGDEYTGWGHARKVYRVELLPVKQREYKAWKTGTPAEAACSLN